MKPYATATGDQQPIGVIFGSDPVIKQRVRQDQLSLIFTRANRGGSYFGVALAMVLWLYAYLSLGNGWALAWAAATHTSQAVRFMWVQRFFKAPAGAASDPKWFRGYVILLGVTGVVWGAAAPVLFDPDNLHWNTFVMVAVITVFNGGQAVAPDRSTVIALCVPMMLGLCLGLALEGSTLFRVMAALFLAYLPMGMRLALQQSDMLAQSLYDRLLNQKLLEELSEKSAEKSRFFAAASHDLRQPMHAIALFSGALEHDSRGTPLHDSASRSLSAVRALSESLDAMLDVSKLDAGVVTPMTEPVALHLIFQRLNAVLQPQASQKGLHLRIRSTPIRLLTDPLLLERMLSNLAGNAVKYTDRGGVLIDARRRGGQVLIEVWDTGVGIPPDQHARIFDEFFQLGNPGRDRSQGLGIGLAIVRRLSELLGLPLSLKSRPGQGSVFRVIVPAGLVLAEAAPAVPPAAAVSGLARDLAMPRRVLVLDDEVDIQEAVRSVLAGQGVEVLAASTVEQALDVLRGPLPVDAFLCDLRLGGGVSGLHFARSLDPVHGIRVPTVIVTGETGPEALRDVRASGLRTVFKPVSADTLLAALAEAVAFAPRPG